MISVFGHIGYGRYCFTIGKRCFEYIVSASRSPPGQCPKRAFWVTVPSGSLFWVSFSSWKHLAATPGFEKRVGAPIVCHGAPEGSFAWNKNTCLDIFLVHLSTRFLIFLRKRFLGSGVFWMWFRARRSTGVHMQYVRTRAIETRFSSFWICLKTLPKTMTFGLHFDYDFCS